jgi:hypothetical protein
MSRTPLRFSTCLGASALALLLSGCFLQQGRNEAAASEARKTPGFGDCTNGKKLDSMSNCAEVCAAAGKGCQNSGCPHPDNANDRYGGLSYPGSLCIEKPAKAFQCYEPFQNEVGVRCCCVAQ